MIMHVLPKNKVAAAWRASSRDRLEYHDRLVLWWLSFVVTNVVGQWQLSRAGTLVVICFS